MYDKDYGCSGFPDAVYTIVKGKVTWRFNTEDPKADAATKEAYDRIKAAFDQAVILINNFTSIEKSLTVSCSPGTPTADANFNGLINVGFNPGYHRAGTAIHEIHHAVDVGTHGYWGQLIQNGVCTGYNTNQMLRL